MHGGISMKKNPLAIMLLVLCLLATLMPATVLAADTGFSDIPAGAWYADSVEWAVDEGITNGIGGGMFGPDNVCTRAQAVTFLWNAADTVRKVEFHPVGAAEFDGIVFCCGKGTRNDIRSDHRIGNAFLQQPDSQIAVISADIRDPLSGSDEATASL